MRARIAIVALFAAWPFAVLACSDDEPTTTSTSTSVSAEPSGSGDDDATAGGDGDVDEDVDVASLLTDAGLEVVDSEETVAEPGAESTLDATVELDGETEVLTVATFATPEDAEAGAHAVDEAWDEECGGVCDAIGPDTVVIGEVLIIADEGSPALDALESAAD